MALMINSMSEIQPHSLRGSGRRCDEPCIALIISAPTLPQSCFAFMCLRVHFKTHNCVSKHTVCFETRKREKTGQPYNAEALEGQTRSVDPSKQIMCKVGSFSGRKDTSQSSHSRPGARAVVSRFSARVDWKNNYNCTRVSCQTSGSQSQLGVQINMQSNEMN